MKSSYTKLYVFKYGIRMWNCQLSFPAIPDLRQNSKIGLPLHTFEPQFMNVLEEVQPAV